MIQGMFLSLAIVASINGGTLESTHPEMAFTTNAIFGKTGTETPVGVFLVQKAYSTRLKKNMLVFMRDDAGVYAIHPTVEVKGQNRAARLASATPDDNRISNGCINIPQPVFDRLWATKMPIVLQVH